MSDAWVPARNFTPTSGRQIDLIVIHDMEAPEASNTAENIASWFAGPNAPRASAHWCLAPETRVLTADLRWRPIGDVYEGDRLVATQETARSRRWRTYEPAVVTRVDRRVAPCLQVTLEDGRQVVCSTDHRWLTKSPNGEMPWFWAAAETLSPGDRLNVPLDVWDSEEDSYSVGGLERPNGVSVVTVSRPVRLLREASWIGRSLQSRTSPNALAVREVVPVGDREVVSIETSTHTFIAEGIVSHNCIDADSKVRCVRDIDVAWHAPGANHNGLGYEHAGYASQSREEWLDGYGQAMLAISATQARIDCAAYGIPIAFVDAAGLQAGHRGITTHWEVTQAFRRSTHWDPGPGFPMDHYLALVNGAPLPDPGPGGPGPVPVDPGLLRRGDRGQAVRDWQTILAGAGLVPSSGVDGVFGPQTESATREFQRILGVTADGVVGPDTRAATARLLAWIAALSPQAPSVPPFLGTVRRGSRGPAVEAVQARLRDRGWNIGVDGVFGARTEEIVRAFQADKGLTVDGVVGPVTWDTLWTAPIT